MEVNVWKWEQKLKLQNSEKAVGYNISPLNETEFPKCTCLIKWNQKLKIKLQYNMNDAVHLIIDTFSVTVTCNGPCDHLAGFHSIWLCLILFSFGGMFFKFCWKWSLVSSVIPKSSSNHDAGGLSSFLILLSLQWSPSMSSWIWFSLT